MQRLEVGYMVLTQIYVHHRYRCNLTIAYCQLICFSINKITICWEFKEIQIKYSPDLSHDVKISQRSISTHQTNAESKLQYEMALVARGNPTDTAATLTRLLLIINHYCKRMNILAIYWSVIASVISALIRSALAPSNLSVAV
jgi:hypothetical protein